MKRPTQRVTEGERVNMHFFFLSGAIKVLENMLLNETAHIVGIVVWDHHRSSPPFSMEIPFPEASRFALKTQLQTRPFHHVFLITTFLCQLINSENTLFQMQILFFP